MPNNRSKTILYMMELKKFTLKILWFDHNIAFSVDHVARFGYSPLTSYFFWPRNDAWYQIKSELDSKPWISTSDKIYILNKVTSIINYWQENNQKKTIREIQEKFPDLVFYGGQ